MHVLLTDRLTCPRCGPSFGLILLAERVEERRVLEGLLGCPNCREKYPVRGGFGDLRAPPRTPLEHEDAPELAHGDEEDALRLAALLGVARGPGHLLLTGTPASHAEALAEMLEDVEVVAVHPALRGRDEVAGVSRIAARPGLPFYDRMLRAVALDDTSAAAFLDEALRVVAPGGRVVVVEPSAEVRQRLASSGLSPVLDEDEVAVASRE